MSHFATIETQIRDIEALKAACAEMGLTVIPDSQARGYGTAQLKGEFVIKLKGPYDIAVNRQPDGTFGLTTDWWDGHVEKEVGTKYGKLLQFYGVHKTMREAQHKGYTVKRKSLADGSIRLAIAAGVTGRWA